MLDTFYSNMSKLIAEARLVLCEPLPQPQKEKRPCFLTARGHIVPKLSGQGMSPEGGTNKPSWHRYQRTPVPDRASASFLWSG